MQKDVSEMRIIEGFRLRQIAGEYYILGEGLRQLQSGFNQVMQMNEAAAYLWENIEGKDFDEETIARLLMAENDFTHEEALEYAKQTLECWKNIPIIE